MQWAWPTLQEAALVAREEGPRERVCWMAALLVPTVAFHAAAGRATRPSRRDRCDRAPSGASAVDERRCAPALNMLFAPSPFQYAV